MHDDRPVDAEILADLLELAFRRLVAGDHAGGIAGRHEEQEEDEGRQDEEHAGTEADTAGKKTDHGLAPAFGRRLRRRTVRALFGSSASRRPSPRMLKASVVIRSAVPGTKISHQATR